MTNWAGAVQTFGEGLFKVGAARLNRENDDIQFMRQKALQELGVQAQKDLQTSNQQFLSGMEQKRQDFEQQQTTTRAGLEIAVQDRGFSHQERLQAQSDASANARLSRQENFALQREKVKSLDDLKQLMSGTMGALDRDLRAAHKDLLGYRADVSKNAGEIDPKIESQFQQAIDELAAERQSLRASFAESLAAYSGVKPKSEPEAPLGSDSRTRAMARGAGSLGNKVGLDAAQNPAPARPARGATPAALPAGAPAPQPSGGQDLFSTVAPPKGYVDTPFQGTRDFVAAVTAPPPVRLGSGMTNEQQMQAVIDAMKTGKPASPEALKVAKSMPAWQLKRQYGFSDKAIQILQGL